jgi:phosphoesterase RecJ-like protein
MNARNSSGSNAQTDQLAVPEHRIARLQQLLARLNAASHIVLTTHVNADGDGTGSEIAVASWLRDMGKTVHMVNPTPWPELYAHLVPDREWVCDPNDARGVSIMSQAELVFVLDTSEPKRIGRVASAIGTTDVLVLDHHVPPEQGFEAVVVEDASACATGELVFDLLTVAGLPKPWNQTIINGIYTAIVTDTGSFRFSNSTNRAHAIAGDMIEQGVDPEGVYRLLYATVPLRRIQLLRRALDSLETDPDYPLAWISVDRATMDEFNATSDDLEGLIEHARSIEGTEVAVLFRETADGATKISLRSAADVDVNVIAREFGGGGHVKAAGALIGQRMDQVKPLVLDAVRRALRKRTPGH